jgi:hypothetical protein
MIAALWPCLRLSCLENVRIGALHVRGMSFDGSPEPVGAQRRLHPEMPLAQERRRSPRAGEQRVIVQITVDRIESAGC